MPKAASNQIKPRKANASTFTTGRRVSRGRTPRATELDEQSSGKQLDIDKIYTDHTVPGHTPDPDIYDSPEFKVAYQKLTKAWVGEVADGEAAPVYSSVYSYLPEYCRIPEGTPVATGIPPTALGGSLRMDLWTEEMANIALKAEFGDVKAGHNAMRQMAEISDVVGGSPDPADTSIRTVAIPGQTYHIRLWTGHMDHQKTVCWQLISNKTGKPRVRPRNLKTWDVSPDQPIMPALSLEECFEVGRKGAKAQRGVGETWAASDGAVIEFVVDKKPVLRLRLPARPTKGPPRIKKYQEYEVLPLEDEQEEDTDTDSDEEAD